MTDTLEAIRLARLRYEHMEDQYDAGLLAMAEIRQQAEAAQAEHDRLATLFDWYAARIEAQGRAASGALDDWKALEAAALAPPPEPEPALDPVMELLKAMELEILVKERVRRAKLRVIAMHPLRSHQGGSD